MAEMKQARPRFPEPETKRAVRQWWRDMFAGIMKFQALAWMCLLVVPVTSCRKQATIARTESFSSKAFMHDPDSEDRVPVYYFIVCGVDSSTVQFAIFGDGAHVVVSSTAASDSSGDMKLTMLDRKSKERWNLAVPRHEQVIVRQDRGLQRIPEFVKFENDGLSFGQTDVPLLNAAAKAYARTTK